MIRTRCETDRLLSWLSELLKSRSLIDVDIVVVERPHSGSLLQITVNDVPQPLAGLLLAPCEPRGLQPEEAEQFAGAGVKGGRRPRDGFQPPPPGG